MKKVAKVLVALVVLLVAYRIGSNMLRDADNAALAAMSAATPSAQWHYTDEVDPITKNVTSRAVGQLHTKSSLDESVVADVVWDCADRTTESLKLEITTFLNETDGNGKLKPLEQDESHAIDYRFDGVASSISSEEFLSKIVIKREYRNSVNLFLIRKTGLHGRYRYPGLYTATGRDWDGDFMYDTKAFYIVDPDFIARIPTSNGTNVMIQFSLEEPSIKKMLSECGLTYGNPPVKTKANSTKRKGEGVAPQI
jgi:hypothetical protein